MKLKEHRPRAHLLLIVDAQFVRLQVNEHHALQQQFVGQVRRLDAHHERHRRAHIVDQLARQNGNVNVLPKEGVDEVGNGLGAHGQVLELASARAGR